MIGRRHRGCGFLRVPCRGVASMRGLSPATGIIIIIIIMMCMYVCMSVCLYVCM